MEINILDAYKSMTGLTTQLITLATGVIALSITFTKDILKNVPVRKMLMLKLSWLAYLLSVIFGIWTMMAITGTILKVSVDGPQPDPIASIKYPSMLQISLFVVGTGLIIWHGVRGLNMASQPKSVGIPPSEDG